MILIAGYLHYLGKIAISKEILEKPGKLTEDEFNEIKAHTYYTYHLMNTQKTQHDAFREQISQMYAELEDQNQEGIIQEILSLLTDWLYNHILENDKLIGDKR